MKSTRSSRSSKSFALIALAALYSATALLPATARAEVPDTPPISPIPAGWEILEPLVEDGEAALPAPEDVDVACTLETPEIAVESVYLPSGGEIETTVTEDGQVIKVYYSGFHIFTVHERGGKFWSEVSEAGAEIEGERAQQLLYEASVYLPLSVGSPDGCQDALASKADQDAKCEMIGIGAGLLGTLGCGIYCGAAAAALGVACKWIVAKACENKPEECTPPAKD
ncbi:MAG: hypothetical protein H6713_41690 [Myxococcales bacterium]|nr:hypothetical protein [Myxococcales bacterium]